MRVLFILALQQRRVQYAARSQGAKRACRMAGGPASARRNGGLYTNSGDNHPAILWGILATFGPITDVGRYQCYALTFWHGGAAMKQLPAVQCRFLPLESLTQPPLHILPLEYPPLTVLLFSLGLFAPTTDYPLLFAFWMALTAIFIYWLLLRYGPRGAALTFALYVLIGGWTTALSRFDLAPAALTLICIIAAERRRWTLAYIALAFGVLLKLYPILLFPPLILAEQHDMGRLRLLPSVMS